MRSVKKSIREVKDAMSQILQKISDQKDQQRDITDASALVDIECSQKDLAITPKTKQPFKSPKSSKS